MMRVSPLHKFTRFYYYRRFFILDTTVGICAGDPFF